MAANIAIRHEFTASNDNNNNNNNNNCDLQTAAIN